MVEEKPSSAEVASATKAEKATAGKEINRGKTLLTWSFSEYIEYERSRGWYVILIFLLGAGIIYAVLTANFLFALFLILFGLIVTLQLRHPPLQVAFTISENGLGIGARFYEWDDMRNFRIVYKPPEIKRLYIDLKNILSPDFSVPLEDQAPDEIRKVLKKYLEEDTEKKEETLIDRASRWMKI
ncbi:hypothetical protein MYX07_03465 [Patescibacteria group bacterium AH-259-L07]|nr:hypothetical protein [Patescibacteria group bacterium AH-259-L07]